MRDDLFVLPGHVISNVADTRERGVGFAVARLARLWSVLVPAMVLTVVCDVVAWHLYDPAIDLMESLVSPWISRQLVQVRVFWFDWVLGLAIAAHLLGARVLIARVPLERLAAPIRWCAGVSFVA